jgi:hypothetical protein
VRVHSWHGTSAGNVGGVQSGGRSVVVVVVGAKVGGTVAKTLVVVGVSVGVVETDVALLELLPNVLEMNMMALAMIEIGIR